jgi:hypothetical protein
MRPRFLRRRNNRAGGAFVTPLEQLDILYYVSLAGSEKVRHVSWKKRQCGLFTRLALLASLLACVQNVRPFLYVCARVSASLIFPDAPTALHTPRHIYKRNWKP